MADPYNCVMLCVRQPSNRIDYWFENDICESVCVWKESTEVEKEIRKETNFRTIDCLIEKFVYRSKFPIHDLFNVSSTKIPRIQ